MWMVVAAYGKLSASWLHVQWVGIHQINQVKCFSRIMSNNN